MLPGPPGPEDLPWHFIAWAPAARALAPVGLWAGRLMRGARIRHTSRRGNEALDAWVARWIDNGASATRQAAAALEVAHPPSQATHPQPKGSCADGNDGR